MRDCFAGIDVGGTRIKVGLADSSGRLISQKALETRIFHDVDSFLEIVAGEIEAQAAAAPAPITAIGIGCPGRVDFISGRVIWLKSKLEFLEGIALARRLGDMLACPVVCDNDVNTILAGEMRFGAGRGRRNVIAVTVGTGIGGALVVDGRMVRGRNWATGHFGYMSHDPDGPRHICGNTGVVEEHASQSGIQRQVRRAFEGGDSSPLTEQLASGEELGFLELFQAAESGDPLGCRLVAGMIAELGVLITNLIYAFDPELVLVGGGIINHRPGVLDAVRLEIKGRLDYLPEGATEILPMALGDAAGVLGGVALAMDAVPQNNQGPRAQGEKQ